MKIQNAMCNSNVVPKEVYKPNLFETGGKDNDTLKGITDFYQPAADVTISEEGLAAIREWDRTAAKAETVEKFRVEDTNFVEFEHYMELRKISSDIRKEHGMDGIEGFMKSIMYAYETLYSRIMEEHENGDRKVTYDLLGEVSVSLDEDLEGLNKAFKRSTDEVNACILTEQVNKAFANPDTSWFFGHKSKKEGKNQESHYFVDDEYRNKAVSIMEQAREQLLTLFHNGGYDKGAGIGIISDILNKDKDFMEKTRKLFYE